MVNLEPIATAAADDYTLYTARSVSSKINIDEGTRVQYDVRMYKCMCVENEKKNFMRTEQSFDRNIFLSYGVRHIICYT